MWVLTTTGFYSATQHRSNKNLLVVRGRSVADLNVLSHWLLEQYGPDAAPEARGFLPFTQTGSDYPWRVMVTKGQFTEFLGWFVMEQLTYGNFKNEVTKRQSQRRHDTYSRVWSDLLAIESEPDADTARSRRVAERGTYRPAGHSYRPPTNRVDRWAAPVLDFDGPDVDFTASAEELEPCLVHRVDAEGDCERCGENVWDDTDAGPTHDENGVCLACDHVHEHVDETAATCIDDCQECNQRAEQLRATANA